MAKKVFLGVGHGGTDPGAVVNGLKEKDVNLGIALAAQKELERAGMEVKLSRYRDEDDTLAEEIRECNAYAPDLAVDVHNNAGGGDGFEAYCSLVGGLSRTLAENIEAQVKAAGQNSRGVKTRSYPGKPSLDYYGFVRETKAPAVLCEFAFLDNAADVSAVASAEARERMGKALALGILDTLGLPWQSPEKWAVRIQHFTRRADAAETSSWIRELGFQAEISADPANGKFVVDVSGLESRAEADALAEILNHQRYSVVKQA